MSNLDYDIIVIGAGHAGCEAANISAKLGCKVLLITHHLDTIAQMSCNPCIGGISKGNLVKEIDALGGLMAKVIDETGIQFRLLNKKKGPAVQSIRAQADRMLYSSLMKELLEKNINLTLKQDNVIDLIVENNKIKGVITEYGHKIYCKVVIITAGTFLNGIIHIGDKTIKGGRISEISCEYLSNSLKKYGIMVSRLKTGTPPRIDGKTINFEILEKQEGDEPPPLFSFWSKQKKIEQVSCYLTYTNEETHKIIRDNLLKSALYGGKIKSIGPRYCPSIEDKIVKFPGHYHQVFLEPLGRNTTEYYPNGLSTSLPLEIQYKYLKTIKGLENIEILRPGYAIEYDFFPPTQLFHSLESKIIENLFFAGQVNGTSGYEEAGAQGIIVGINAVQKILNNEPLILKRNEAYTGVMIDDLVLKGTNEPYRMFTSRAEFRLLLRHTNTHIRLLKYSKKLNLLNEIEIKEIEKFEKDIERFIIEIKNYKLSLNNEKVNNLLISFNENKLETGTSLYEILKRPNITKEFIFELDNNFKDKYKYEVIDEAEISIKYQGYINKQLKEIEKIKKYENYIIPKNIDYFKINSLKKEAKEKLDKIQPKTISEALKIPGITPSDINNLIFYIKKQNEL
ncbi:MAG TPA: tRNA uridine-5-carboxymethylaminomethyl(34) synthesis enzyme MnmG [bacterium]|nr:tRNA uridine-5-carboxymethylaminomethyl(34) synthesis enzyme MnmG [bacterium]HOL46579.1 tRNA uridine-5-carboxymethylaminomethyl(34) synthesis enzyme MnmG [bacterium]HPQ17850.1 tRNA uridine-5-carboxymethylaminomethyl(34) synthesis enzyme MnmG [bacterium]